MEIDRQARLTDEAAWSGLYGAEDGRVMACWIYGGDPDPEGDYPDCVGSVYINVWDSYADWENEICESDGSDLIFYENSRFGAVLDFVEWAHGLTIVQMIHRHTDPCSADA